MNILRACSSPTGLRRIHGWATVAWLAVTPVVVLTDLRNSIPLLVGISIYAIVTSHWGAWQSARVEVVQDEDANVADVLAGVERLEAAAKQP